MRGRCASIILSRIFSGPIDTSPFSPIWINPHLSLLTRRLPSFEDGCHKNTNRYSAEVTRPGADPAASQGRDRPRIDIGKNRCRCLTLRVAPEFQDCEPLADRL